MSFVQKRCLRNHHCGTSNSHLHSIDHSQHIVMGNSDATSSQPSNMMAVIIKLSHLELVLKTSINHGNFYNCSHIIRYEQNIVISQRYQFKCGRDINKHYI
eukprot:494229_1